MKKYFYYNQKRRVGMMSDGKLKKIEVDKLNEIKIDVAEEELDKIKKGCTAEIIDKKLVLTNIED